MVVISWTTHWMFPGAMAAQGSFGGLSESADRNPSGMPHPVAI